MTDTRDSAEVSLPVFGRIAAVPADRAAKQLSEIARLVRRRDADMIATAGQGHIGGDFSVIDILVTLYFCVMNVDPAHPRAPERDRLVLSKGHAAGALYTVLAARGFFDPAELSTFMAPGSRLSGHPSRTKVPGVEASTGPLGHGLPIALGMALAGKLDGSSRRVFVVVGDGELEEGSNWEAMMPAAHAGLDNLVLIVDANGLQQGAAVDATTQLEPLAGKLEAFGMHVVNVAGHDFPALLNTLGAAPQPGRPTAVIAHTVKGYPISFMAGQVGWHHKVPSHDQLQMILAELGEPA